MVKCFYTRSAVVSQFFVLCLIIESIFFGKSAVAEIPVDIPTNHYIFSGLPSNTKVRPSRVKEIFKDSNGYLWLGTYNGLYRYDGYQLEDFSYDHTGKPRLSNQEINNIEADPYGNLWIATEKGLNRLNLKNYHVTKFYSYSEKGVREETSRQADAASSENTNYSLSDNRTYALLLDENKMLIGTNSGLDAFDLETNKVSKILENYSIRSLLKASKESIWIGTADYQLLRYNLQTRKIVSYDLPVSYRDSALRKIVLQGNTLWLASDKGLIGFNTEKQTAVPAIPKLNNIDIADIVLSSDQSIWVALRRGGLYRYYPGQTVLQRIDSRPHDPRALKTDILSGLYFDKEANDLWVGDVDGVRRLSLSRSTYLVRNFSSFTPVWSFIKDMEGNFIIGSEKGLTIHDFQDNKSNHYTTVGLVADIEEDNDKFLLGSGKGLFALDKNSRELVYLTPKLTPLKDTSKKYVLDIAKGDAGIYYLATHIGIIQWNDKTQKPIIYKVDGPSKNSDLKNRIEKVYIHQSTVLAGTHYGLFYVDKQNQALKSYLIDEIDGVHNGTSIESMMADREGRLWFSSVAGLFKVQNRRVIAHYTTDDGLPDNAIRSMAIIDDILWAATDKGLAAFRIDGETFEKIHLNSDLFDIEFNARHFLSPKDGWLYICSMEGVFYFNPAEFTSDSTPPKVKLTEFRLFNKTVSPGSKWLAEAIEYSNKITLGYQDSMLSFGFSGLNYRNPNHLYAYQVEGITSDQNWIYTDADNRRAVFTVQNPGDYIFRVKAGWSENVWSDEVTELHITVLPPWWRTTWAYTIYTLSVLLALMWLYRWRTRTMHLRAVELENQVVQRTQEIHRQKNLIERLLAKKNEMFENISHELRTPLTLIRGPIAELINKNPKDLDALRIVERNTDRLAALVEQLLTISSAQQIEQKEQGAPLILQSISEITQELCLSFESIAKTCNIEFEYSIEQEILIRAAERAFEDIVMNLLSNAFKYTEPGGRVYLDINSSEKGVQLFVQDTGIGIPEEHLNTIFERFTRLAGVESSKIEGVGLGLALVKQLVELHHWSIEVDSCEGIGSKFTLNIPLSNLCDSGQDKKSATLAKGTCLQIDYLRQTLSREDDRSIATNVHLNQNRNKTRVLVIDDTLDMLKYLRELLEPEFACLFADSGEQGLALADSERPDLIICDVMMPGLSGFDVLDRLRADLQTSHIPVLMLTAKGDKQSRLKGLDKLADHYITKPFDGEELKVRIRSLMSLQRMRQDTLSRQLLTGEKPVKGKSPQLHLSKRDRMFIEKWESVVSTYYGDESITVEKLAEYMHISSSQLLRKAKSLLGKGPKEFFDEYRIAKAKELLATGDLSITLIAEAVGFRDHNYFSTRFKNLVKITPSEYRRQQSNPD